MTLTWILNRLMNELIGTRFFVMFAQLLTVLMIPSTMVSTAWTQIENIAAAGVLPTDTTNLNAAQQVVVVFVALTAIFLLIEMLVMVSGVNSTSKRNTAYRKGVVLYRNTGCWGGPCSVRLVYPWEDALHDYLVHLAGLQRAPLLLRNRAANRQPCKLPKVRTHLLVTLLLHTTGWRAVRTIKNFITPQPPPLSWWVLTTFGTRGVHAAWPASRGRGLNKQSITVAASELICKFFATILIVYHYALLLGFIDIDIDEKQGNPQLLVIGAYCFRTELNMCWRDVLREGLFSRQLEWGLASWLGRGFELIAQSWWMVVLLFLLYLGCFKQLFCRTAILLLWTSSCPLKLVLFVAAVLDLPAGFRIGPPSFDQPLLLLSEESAFFHPFNWFVDVRDSGQWLFANSFTYIMDFWLEGTDMLHPLELQITWMSLYHPLWPWKEA